MQELGIPTFRDPKERLKDIVLMHGYEDQKDQPLFDRIDSHTHEVALQVLTIIEIRLEHMYTIPQNELTEFILSNDWVESIPEVPRVLH